MNLAAAIEQEVEDLATQQTGDASPVQRRESGPRTRVRKSASGKHEITFGVVLAPDEGGEADDIADLAHRFLAEYDGLPADLQPVESWVAEREMKVAGLEIPAGAWVMAVNGGSATTWERARQHALGEAG